MQLHGGKCATRLCTASFAVLVLAALPVAGKREKKPKPPTTLDEYLQHVTQVTPPSPTTGSLWDPLGRFADLARDYKAERVGDAVTINVVQSTTAAASGTLKSTRQFSASSGLSALYGTFKPTAHLRDLFSPQSQESLNGQASTASSSVLTTTLTGTVVRVLPNGYLVVEAEREVLVNNQREKLILRGVVRPGDLSPDNSIPSTAIADVEIEVEGKGVISEGSRPPHKLTRALLKIFGF